MLKSDSTITRGHSTRSMRIDSPDSFDTSNRASPANPSVLARKVSGSNSVTPSFSTGQLKPQVRLRRATSSRPDAGTAWCSTGRGLTGGLDVGSSTQGDRTVDLAVLRL